HYGIAPPRRAIGSISQDPKPGRQSPPQVPNSAKCDRSVGIKSARIIKSLRSPDSVALLRTPSRSRRMFLGDILVGRGLVGAADIEAALARQLTEGGRLGDNLIAMGLLTAEQLTEVMNTAPAVPASLEETGISQRSLLNLMLKFMLIEGCETVLDLAERLKLPRRGVQQLIEDRK